MLCGKVLEVGKGEKNDDDVRAGLNRSLTDRFGLLRSSLRFSSLRFSSSQENQSVMNASDLIDSSTQIPSD